MRSHINKDANERILRLSFESFLYDYDSTVKIVEDFLNIHDHKRPKEFFKPELSINNTQKIRLYPGEKENIKIIENELSEYLFPFEDYTKPNFTNAGFLGAGRKMQMID